MSVQLLANILIGLALIGFIGSRQLRWRYVDRSSMWRQPLILAAIGLATLSTQSNGLTVTPVDAVLIGVELAVAVVIGLLMARITVIRRAETPDSRGRILQIRTGGAGMALWIALIGVRVGLDVLGGAMGAHLLTATGVILLTVAANRAASALLLDTRLPQQPLVKA